MIEYELWNPTGNRTVLVKTAVPISEQPHIAAVVMAAEPTAEQVGFVTETEGGVYLRMAGGEFCGNAAMTAAALWSRDHGLDAGESTVVSVEITGRTVFAAVTARNEKTFVCTVEMPLPEEITQMQWQGKNLPAVRFEGITHVLCDRMMEKTEAEQAVKTLCRKAQADAMGLLFWEKEEERMTPLVYVPGAETLFWESSCASGTAAVGAYAARAAGQPVQLRLRQPGGDLKIAAVPDGTLRLMGMTALEKTASLSEGG